MLVKGAVPSVGHMLVCSMDISKTFRESGQGPYAIGRWRYIDAYTVFFIAWPTRICSGGGCKANDQMRYTLCPSAASRVSRRLPEIRLDFG